MAFQPEVTNYDSGVYQLQITDPAQAGAGGVLNAPLLNLANRTNWLKANKAAIASVSTKNAAYTIAASDDCSLIVANNAGTVTLPAAAGIYAGFTVGIANSNNTTTVNCNGMSVVIPNGVAAGNVVNTSFLLGLVGSFVVLRWDGTYWRVIAMSGDLNYKKSGSSSIVLPASNAAAGTVGSSGYSIDPSGKISQWAYIMLTDSASVTWTFPTSFVSSPLKIRGTNFSVAAGQGSSSSGIYANGTFGVASLPSATAVQLFARSTGTTGTNVVFLVEAEGY